MMQAKPWEMDWTAGTTVPAGPTLRPITPPRPPAPQTPTQAALDAEQVESANLGQAKTQLEIQQLQDKVGGKTPDELEEARREMLNVIRTANEAIGMSQEGWFASGFGSGAARQIEGTTARDLTGKLNIIGSNTAFSRLQKMREQSPTGGALGNVTEMELKLLRDSIASLDPGQSDATFQESMRRVIDHYQNVYRKLGGDDQALRQALGVIAGEEPAPPVANAPNGGTPPASPPADRMDRTAAIYADRTEGGRAQITTGPVIFSTDQDRRFAAVVQSVLDRGGSVEEANQLAEEYGYAPGLDGRGIYNAQEWDEAVRYNRTKPKGAPKARVGLPETGRREQGAVEGAISSTAASPVGAYTTGFANTVLPGLTDEAYGAILSSLTGQPLDQAIAEANLRKGLIRDENPGAFLAGEVMGGVGTQLGVAGAASRVAPKLIAASPTRTLAPRAMAADASYGAAYGAGEGNEDRLGGAVLGGVSGAAGGVLGRGGTKAVAGAIAPRVAPAVRTLRDKGVRTTLGQSIGPRAAALEEKLTSIPGVGDLVISGRKRALGDFNRAVIDDALKPIGASLPEGTSGTSAMRFAQSAFDKAYDTARAGMRLSPDAPLVQELAALEQKVLNGALDDAGAKRLRKIYDAHVGRRLKAGPLDGDNYKRMMSSLGKLQRGTRQGNPELSAALGELRDVLDGSARRSSPAEAAAALDAADQGYALFVRAENAAGRRGGETGAFTPRQYDAAVQRGDGSVRSRAYLRGEALGQDMAQAGIDVLGDQVPNSGTVDRGLVAGSVLGAAFLEPSTLAVTGGLAAAYAPGMRDILANVFARRSPKAAEAIAAHIRKRSKLAGTAGVPLGLAYSVE